MDDKFDMFIQDIPVEMLGFVCELDKELTDKGCKRVLKSAKSGFVTSYQRQDTQKTLLNYVFRKSGVKMRIYAAGVGKYEELLNQFPEKMKADIIKAGECKKLKGEICSPTCPAGYTFYMDGVEYKKCRNMAFFHDLNAENSSWIHKLIQFELNV